MPSGKQILLAVLKEYSQRGQTDDALSNVTERVKSALCRHCSTSGETMEKIEKMGWLSQSDEDGLVKQGLGISKSNVFLSDLFEEIIAEDDMPERVKKRFPTLTQADYSDSLEMIWHLLSALQYWDELSSVENDGVMDNEAAETLLNTSSRFLQTFRKEPW